MTRFEFGNIVLVPFPFTDQTATKQRPAVVISSAAYNTKRPDLIIMAVTSQARQSAAIGEVFVQQWREAGLLKPSTIKPIVTTIEKTLIIRKLGRLKKDDIDALKESLQTIIG